MNGHFSDDPLQSEDFEDQNFVGLTQLQELAVTLQPNQSEEIEQARIEILAEHSNESEWVTMWESGSWAPVADSGGDTTKDCDEGKDSKEASAEKAVSTTKGCEKLTDNSRGKMGGCNNKAKPGSLEEFHDFVLKQDDKVHDALGMLLDYIFDKAKNG